MSEAVERFEVRVDDEALVDLHERLVRARVPEALPGRGWDDGVPPAYLEELVHYWRDEYDWRREEARLNRFEHFRTEIDGQAVHFVHARSPHADARPLLLIHGWPGSIVEFLGVVEPLTHPDRHGGTQADACHVVAPSLPGYGFSGPTRDAGWDPHRIAAAFATLMARLGYDGYVAQGGDWGAQIATRLGALDETHCAALHLNMPLAEAPTETEGIELTEAERADVAALARFASAESGYAQEQSTKPQTIGAALHFSGFVVSTRSNSAADA